jgi:hypothetical protein
MTLIFLFSSFLILTFYILAYALTNLVSLSFAIAIFLSIATYALTPPLAGFLFNSITLPTTLFLVGAILLSTYLFLFYRFGIKHIENVSVRKLTNMFKLELMNVIKFQQPVYSLAIIFFLMLIGSCIFFGQQGTIFSYGDGLSYRLSATAHYFQEKQLINSYLQGYIHLYPKNLEFISLWSVWLAGSDKYVFFYNILFCLLTFFSMFTLTNFISSMTNSDRVIIAVLITSSAPFFLYMGNGYVDNFIFAVVTFWFTLFTTLVLIDNLASRYFLAMVGGVVLGYLSLLKQSFVPFAMLGCIGPLAFLFVKVNRKQLFTIAALLAATTFVVGGSWYVMHWIQYGSPTYPLHPPQFISYIFNKFGIDLNPGFHRLDGFILQEGVPLHSSIAFLGMSIINGSKVSFITSVFGVGSFVGTCAYFYLQRRLLFLTIFVFLFFSGFFVPGAYVGRYIIGSGGASWSLAVGFFAVILFGEISSKNLRPLRYLILLCLIIQSVPILHRTWDGYKSVRSDLAISIIGETVLVDRLWLRYKLFRNIHGPKTICATKLYRGERESWYHYWGKDYRNKVIFMDPKSLKRSNPCDFFVMSIDEDSQFYEGKELRDKNLKYISRFFSLYFVDKSTIWSEHTAVYKKI